MASYVPYFQALYATVAKLKPAPELEHEYRQLFWQLETLETELAHAQRATEMLIQQVTALLTQV